MTAYSENASGFLFRFCGAEPSRIKEAKINSVRLELMFAR